MIPQELYRYCLYFRSQYHIPSVDTDTTSEFLNLSLKFKVEVTSEDTPSSVRKQVWLINVRASIGHGWRGFPCLTKMDAKYFSGEKFVIWCCHKFYVNKK